MANTVDIGCENEKEKQEIGEPIYSLLTHNPTFASGQTTQDFDYYQNDNYLILGFDNCPSSGYLLLVGNFGDVYFCCVDNGTTTTLIDYPLSNYSWKISLLRSGSICNVRLQLLSNNSVRFTTGTAWGVYYNTSRISKINN